MVHCPPTWSSPCRPHSATPPHQCPGIRPCLTCPAGFCHHTDSRDAVAPGRHASAGRCDTPGHDGDYRFPPAPDYHHGVRPATQQSRAAVDAGVDKRGHRGAGAHGADACRCRHHHQVVRISGRIAPEESEIFPWEFSRKTHGGGARCPGIRIRAWSLLFMWRAVPHHRVWRVPPRCHSQLRCHHLVPPQPHPLP